MVGIISGSQLGLQQSSYSVLGGLGLLGQSGLGRAGENVYVNAMTGNVVVRGNDEMLFGVGQDVGVGRRYNSLQTTTDYDNNDNWKLTPVKRLTGIPASPYNSGTIKRVDSDGSILTYTWDGSYAWGGGTGAYVNTDGDGPYDVVRYDTTESAWKWHDGSSQVVETYEVTGSTWRLLNSKDGDGNSVTYSYTGTTKITRVTTASPTHSEYVDFIYTGDNLMRLETHYWDGSSKTLTRTHYGYDGSDRLTSVTVDLSPEDNTTSDGNTYSITYTYDGATDRIASVTQKDGSSVAFTYDGSGRVTTVTQLVEYGDSRTTTFTYNSSTQTTITDDLGLNTVIVYNSKGWIGSITPPAPTGSGGGQATEFYYNNNGDVTTIIFGGNNRFDYTYDARGNRIAERDGTGNTVVRTFSSKNELLAETRYAVADPDSPSSTNYVDQTYGWGSTTALSDPLTTRYAYDGEGHLRFVVTAEGRVSEYVYNTAGQQTSAIEYAGHTYSLSGLAFDASIAATALESWVTGLGTTRATALRTDTTYNFRGAIDTVTSYGVTESDGDGDETATTQITKLVYLYDQAGMLLDRRPYGSSTGETFVYDGMGRVVMSTDYLGKITYVTYDDDDRQTITTVVTGEVTRTTTSTFNRAGELTSVVDLSGPVSATSTYQYDDLGRLRMVTDPTGAKTYALYDQEGRKVADIEHDGTITEYRYHAINDQVAVTIRYKTLLTSTQLGTLVDSAGKPANVTLSSLSLTTDAADRWDWRVYDRGNRLIETIDDLGFATIYTYDGAARLTKATAYATALSSGTLSGWRSGSPPDTLQTPSTDSTNDRTTRNFYDKAGFVVGTLDAKGYLTQITRDGGGRPTETIAYSTLTSSTYWASGTFAELIGSISTTSEDVHNYFIYDRRGFLIGQVNGEGELTRYSYTALGHIATEVRGQDLNSTQIAALPVLPAAGSGEILETTEYTRNLYGDVLTEVRKVRNSDGSALINETDNYTYDTNRRLLSVTRYVGTADERTTTYRYDGLGRLTGVLTGEGTTHLVAPTYSSTVTGTSGANTLNGTSGTNLIQGLAGGDTIDGLGGNDRLEGGDDNDSLQGGTGADEMVGGAGNDSYYVDDAGDLVIETFNRGADRVYSSISYTLSASANIETLSTANDAGTTAINLGGNDYANIIIGNAGINALYGYGGDDTITANGGGDWLIGGKGKDYLTGSSGADIFVFAIGDGEDTISDFSIGSDLIDLRGFSGTPTVTQVNSDTVVSLGEWKATLLGITATNLTNASFVFSTPTYDQTLTGTSGANTITGGAGKDLAQGLGGGDTISGLGGDDRLEGGTSGDTIDGGADNDIVYGGAGEDTMTGGAGADRFLFITGDTGGGSNLDIITDFTVGTDILDFSAIGTPTVTQSGSDTIVEIGSSSNRVKVKLTGITASTVTSSSFYIAPGTAGSVPAAATRSVDNGPDINDPTYGTWGTIYNYDAADRLISKVSPDGNDATGNRTLYYYNTDGRLVYEIDALGGVVEHTYNAFGERTGTTLRATAISGGTLAGLTGGLVNSTVTSAISSNSSDGVSTITYDDAGSVLSITDARGSTTTYTNNAFREWVETSTSLNDVVSYLNDSADYLGVTRVMDRRGQVSTQTVEGSSVTSFTYDAFGRTTQVTDPLSVVRSTLYDRAHRAVQVKVAPTTGDERATTYAYDARGNLITETDGLSHAKTWVHDEFSRKITFTSDVGRVTITRNKADGQVWKVTTDAGTTERHYNKDGRQDWVKDGLTNQTSTAYDEAGRVETVTDALGKVTRYHYDAADRVDWVKVDEGGLNLTTYFAYDAKGQQITVTDAAGVATSITYSAAGDRTKVVVDPTGLNLRTDYVYDKAGRLIYSIDASNRPTRFEYDDFGNVIRRTAYAGTITPTTTYSLSYVAGQINTNSLASNALTRVTRAVFDAGKRQAYSIDAAGTVTAYTYNAAGEVKKTVQYNATYSGTDDPTKSYMDGTWVPANANATYDRVSRMLYRADGLQTYAVDPEGYVTEYKYDDDHLVTDQIRYATTYTVTDSTAEATLRSTIGTLPSTAAVTTFAYDTSGRLVDTYDPMGVRTHLVLDAVGQATDIVRAYGHSTDESTTRRTYDAVGRVLSEIKGYGDTASASKTTWEYDGAGRATKETRAEDVSAEKATTEYTYDAMGRVLTEKVQLTGPTSPTYATTTYQYDAAGNRVKVTDAAGGVGYFYYDALARVTLQVDPEKYATKTEYDAAGQVWKVTRHKIVVPGSVVVGTPPSVTTDSSDALTQFEYDKLGRVTKVVDALGNYEQYTLNAFGERTTVRNKLGYNTTYTYDKLSRVKTETLPVTAANSGGTQIAVVNTFAYDARGNVTQTIEGYGLAVYRTTTFTYDKADRLTDKVGDTVTITSQTDLTTTSAAPTETMVYDARGNVTKITKADGARTWLYYDKADRKIAEVQESDTATSKGVLRTWTYDDRNNATSAKVYETTVTLPSSAGGTPPSAPSGVVRETKSFYDHNNRLIETRVESLQFGYWNGTSYTTASGDLKNLLTYDAAGNVVRQQVTANGVEASDSYFFYDKLNRKVGEIREVDASVGGYLTVFTLDAEGNVTREKRYATVISTALSTSTALSVYETEATTEEAAGGNLTRQTDFTYDKVGRRLTESRANVTYYTIGSTGALGSSSNGASTITYTYNGLGGVLTKTEATGESVTYTFDAINRQASETTSAFDDYDGGAQSYRRTLTTYNGLNQVLTTTVDDGNSETTLDRATTYAYAVGGRLTSVTDAVGATHTYGYDVAGRVVMDKIVRTKANGSTTVTQATNLRYDVRGQITWQTMATYNGSSWSFEAEGTRLEYNSFGEMTGRGIGSAAQEYFVYDKAGRVWKSNQGDGVTKLYLYDGLGNASMTLAVSGGTTDNLSTYTTSMESALSTLTASGALGTVNLTGINLTIADYDMRGQLTLTKEKYRTGIYNYSTGATGTSDVTRSKTYNAFGEVLSETDANGNTTEYKYNAMGRLIETKQPQVTWRVDGATPTTSNPITTYFYDRAGRMVGVRDANQYGTSAATTRRLLAGSGLNGSAPIVLGQYLDTGSTTLQVGNLQAVDAFGEVRKLTDGNGKLEERSYDKLGQVLVIKRPERSGASRLEQYFKYDEVGQRVREWNNQLNTSAGSLSDTITLTDFDTKGRVTAVTERINNGAGTDDYTTGYTYTWAQSGTGGTTTGLGEFGGWTTLTTHQAEWTVGTHYTSRETRDYFGRVIDKIDLGTTAGTNYDFTFDKAGQLTGQTNSLGGTIDRSYFTSGNIATVSTFSNGDIVGETADDRYGYASYAYDLNGNRVFEHQDTTYYEWGPDPVGEEGPELFEKAVDYQNTVAYFDALNRTTSFVDNSNPIGADATAVAVAYEYDRNGNLVHVDADYYDDTAHQDLWYQYDALNRILITKGALSGSTVVAGSTGTAISYDSVGRRAQAITGSTTETYAYTEDSYLASVTINSVVRATNDYDYLGRLEVATEYDPDGTTVRYERVATYDDKSQLIQDEVSILDEGDFETTTTDYFYHHYDLTTEAWDGGYFGLVLHSESTSTDGDVDDTKVNFLYAALDSFRAAGNTFWPDSEDTYAQYSWHVYDDNGSIVKAQIYDGFYISDGRTMDYLSNVDGMVMRRLDSVEGDPAYYLYFDGKRYAEVSNNGAQFEDYAATINHRNNPGAGPSGAYADFDQNYNAINPTTTPNTGFTYTVRTGDTLQSIATALWGDASLWYLVAEANGLTGAEYLVAGRTLSVPGSVTNAANVHNNADTFQPYDPNSVVGETFPGAPRQLGIEHPHCGPEVILIALIAAAVAAYVGPMVADFIGPILGAGTAGGGASGAAAGTVIAAGGGASGAVATASVAQIATAVISGAAASAAGSIVSQGVAVLAGWQDKFDWKQVGMAALGGGIGAGLGASGIFGNLLGTGTTASTVAQQVLQGALGNALTQGIGVATGLQDKFDWGQVAVSAVSAGVSSYVGAGMTVNPNSKFSVELQQAMNNIGSNLIGGIVGAGARSLIDGSSFGDNLMATMPGLIGSSLGNAIGHLVAAVRLAPESEMSAVTAEELEAKHILYRVEDGRAIALRNQDGSVQMDPTYSEDQSIGLELATPQVPTEFGGVADWAAEVGDEFGIPTDRQVPLPDDFVSAPARILNLVKDTEVRLLEDNNIAFRRDEETGSISVALRPRRDGTGGVEVVRVTDLDRGRLPDGAFYQYQDYDRLAAAYVELAKFDHEVLVPGYNRSLISVVSRVPIVMISNSRTSYEDGNYAYPNQNPGVVYWNPVLSMRTMPVMNGAGIPHYQDKTPIKGRVPPMLTLLHELGHAFLFLENPSNYWKDLKPDGSFYNNKGERELIRFLDPLTSTYWGTPQRYNVIVGSWEISSNPVKVD